MNFDANLIRTIIGQLTFECILMQTDAGFRNTKKGR